MNTPATHSFLARLPWEKLLIWTLFLLAVYALRHFFFVIFMTFIISFCMRSLVVFILRRISPTTQPRWLQVVTTLVCFIMLLVTLYGLGRYFVPKLIDQGEALVKKFSTFEKSPRAAVDDLLRDSVGVWLFQEQYGGQDDPRYQEALERSLQRGVHFREYERFRTIVTAIEEEFELSAATETRPGLAALKTAVPSEYDRQLLEFYGKIRAGDPARAPYEPSHFRKLREAYLVDARTFSATFDELMPAPEASPDRLEREREAFELHERARLLQQWKKGELAEKLEAELQATIVSGISRIGRNLGQALPYIVFLPVQLALALLLSLFITLDVPKLARGLRRLEASKVSHFYEEIAPGLISFGRLIGRAFQAQGVIALVNTVLTFGAVKFLGVENEVFLCAIVFLCSFIPVLGTVFSTVPIAIMAMIQDNGTIMLAVWVVVAILIIHFIETSILNPKIVGEMLHLHPVLVLAILTIGEHFFGVWGLLLGVPVMVYIIRFVILDEGIPGLIEPIRKRASVPA